MSTHHSDFSGQRAVTTVLNDPARTASTVSAKAGDDVLFTLSGVRETRIGLPPTARVETREFTKKVRKADAPSRGRIVDGHEVMPDGSSVYEDPYLDYVLVIPGYGVTVFGRASKTDPEDEGYEHTPHSTVSVRKMGATLHSMEAGVFVSEFALADLPMNEETIRNVNTAADNPAMKQILEEAGVATVFDLVRLWANAPSSTASA